MKKAVSEEELLDILNRELESNPECTGCVFSGPVFPLDDPDETGCNWDQTAVILTCSGEAVGRGRPIAHRVIESVARRFNLEM